MLFLQSSRGVIMRFIRAHTKSKNKTEFLDEFVRCLFCFIIRMCINVFFQAEIEIRGKPEDLDAAQATSSSTLYMQEF